ncbi:MOSC domain-containing protein [Microbacterium sp. JZ101]
MPHVSALYRHPVKGFTAEERDALVVQADGRIEGDRVLAFRFADAATPEEHDGLDYWPKSKGLALMDFPSLARLRLRFDEDLGRLSVRLDDELVLETTLDAEGRREASERIARFVLSTPDGRRLERGGRLPLVLVGDGRTSRFQDRPRGFVSLHGRPSVRAVDEVTPDAVVDDRRFRSNIVVDGLEPWSELDWRGRVRIGEVVFAVQRPIIRCLAIHADPDSGERDAPLLKTLTRVFGQAEPTLGILLLPAEGGGTVRLGDSVELLD